VEVLTIPEPPAALAKIVVNNTIPKRVERSSQVKPVVKQEKSHKTKPEI
jgi:hypothetical protein